MITKFSLKINLHKGVICLLVFSTLASFYNNRGLYISYLHRRHDDPYLSTHLLQSMIRKQLGYRMSKFPSHGLYLSIEKLYKNKQLILPNDNFFNNDIFAGITGKDVWVKDRQPTISNCMVSRVLREGKYSFFYSPMLFSPSIKKMKITSHKEFSSMEGWKAYPLLIVLVSATSDDPAIHVLHQGKYLFFIPSQHFALGSGS